MIAKGKYDSGRGITKWYVSWKLRTRRTEGKKKQQLRTGFIPLKNLIADSKRCWAPCYSTARALMTHVIQGCRWLMGTFSCSEIPQNKSSNRDPIFFSKRKWTTRKITAYNNCLKHFSKVKKSTYCNHAIKYCKNTKVKAEFEDVYVSLGDTCAQHHWACDACFQQTHIKLHMFSIRWGNGSKARM